MVQAPEGDPCTSCFYDSIKLCLTINKLSLNSERKENLSWPGYLGNPKYTDKTGKLTSTDNVVLRI